MPMAAFCGLRHSESDVYFVELSSIGLPPRRSPVAIHRARSLIMSYAAFFVGLVSLWAPF